MASELSGVVALNLFVAILVVLVDSAAFVSMVISPWPSNPLPFALFTTSESLATLVLCGWDVDVEIGDHDLL